jgi:predicted transcriptional regulator YdeE
MAVQTRIETCGPLEFMGVALYGDPRASALRIAWELFGEYADEASISRIGRDIYGLQVYHPRFPKRFELTYLACLPREPGMALPIRMVSKSLPECTYAVQAVLGGVAGIDDALVYLYRDFIPHHGYRVSLPIDFEKYCNVQDHDRCPDQIEVWVPIRSV